MEPPARAPQSERTVASAFVNRMKPLGDTDVITEADLRALASVPGPCASVFLPTHRHGPETRQGPVRLRRLIAEAHSQLAADGFTVDDADEILAPMEALLDDERFWQHQADGLALFAATDRMVWLRLARPLQDSVVVGSAFRLRALLPEVEGDGVFDVLALSQKQVRLLRANRTAVAPLDIGSTPTSLEEALAFEDPERQLQVRSAGGRTAKFHGHGAGEELDKGALERYFRAVDHGLSKVLGTPRPPLVLACVDYYLPIYRSVSDHPAILDDVVEGNPEHRSAAELHDAALPLVEPLLSASREQAEVRYHEAVGTERSVQGIRDVVTAAAQGRIEVVLVAADAADRWGALGPGPEEVTLHELRSPQDTDLIDLAVRDALRHGGEVYTAEGFDDPDGIGAILRF